MCQIYSCLFLGFVLKIELGINISHECFIDAAKRNYS